MKKHLAILQRWDGDNSESLLFQYSIEKELEAKSMYEKLKKEAKKKKMPVTYRMIELDGEIQYEGKAEDEMRKSLGVKQIIIQDGKIHNVIPHATQKDIIIS